MYIDYTFYKNEYGGTVLETEFTKLNIQAQAKVDYFTFNRIPKLSEVPLNVKFAVCEVIDFINEQTHAKDTFNASDRRIASETIGSHSVSYKYGDEINKSKVATEEEQNKKIYGIVATYLMNEQNLMYRGVVI